MANLRCHPEHRHPGREATGIHTSCVRTCLIAMFVALILVACGDDDSSFAPRNSEGSSICEDCDDESSSNGKEIATNSSSYRNDKSSSSAKADGSEYDAFANTLKDLRDGQTYKTVKIGDQVWMAENLNFETDKSSCYSLSVEYCDKYGRLYTWAAVMDSVGIWSVNGKGCGYDSLCSPTYPVRGVCPDGWHLPDTTEWNTLFSAVGGKSVAGIKLKSTSGWIEYEGQSGNGTDAFSFSVLPAGYGVDYKNYYDEGNYADFWSSTEIDGLDAYSMYLYRNYDNAYLNRNYKVNWFSVRCLKDDP